MRKLFVAGNWKMNKDYYKGFELADKINNFSEDVDKIDIGVFPPSIYLSEMKKKCANIIIGAQNVFYKNEGAFTGEISPYMLNSIDINWTIIGHSERRNIFMENSEWISKKVKASLSDALKIIICIGENFDERQKGMAYDRITMQLKNIFYNISEENLDDITIAYEPIWAIGTGESASPEDAEKMHKHIRNVIKNLYNKDISNKIKILYGGSVKPHNAESLLQKENIDGALIGGASLKADSFIDICKTAIDLSN